MAENNLETQPVRDKWTPPPLNIENFNEADRWWRLTHFFLEWKEDWIYPCFGIIPLQEETVEAAMKNKNFYKLELFSLDLEDLSIRDQWLNKMSWMRNAFVHFFKEVFEIKSFELGYQYSFDLCRIGLPKQKYDEIMAVITKFGLTDVSDLIFFIIAKAQDFYSDKVRFFESKDQAEKIRKIEQQVEDAISLIERVIKDPFKDVNMDEPSDKLLRINFSFEQKPSIRITDPVLTSLIVKDFREGFNNGYFKDWKLQLQLTKFIYEEKLDHSLSFALQGLYTIFSHRQA